MEKRNVKESAESRATVYGLVATADYASAGYEIVGMGDEGLIVRNVAANTYMVVKVVAKSLEFNAQEAMEILQEKKERAAEKELKHQEKVAKAKAKREKEAKEAKEAEEAEESATEAEPEDTTLV